MTYERLVGYVAIVFSAIVGFGLLVQWLRNLFPAGSRAVHIIVPIT